MDTSQIRWEKQWRPTARDLDGETWDRVWEELTAGYATYAVPRGTVLYEQGGPADGVVFLHRGQVQLECCDSSGKKRVVYALFDGLTVGEDECMFGGPRAFRAVCNTPCQITRIPAAEFRRRVEHSHALALKLFQLAARRAQMLSQLLVRDSFLDAGKRVARFLVSQAEYYGRPEDGGLCLTVRLTHQQLADFLGISWVAVSQCVRGLEKQGLMEKREGRFFLPNPAALREWSSPL